MKEYEIWVGKWHGGQGSTETTEPQMWAKITAIDFEIACLKYEIIRMLKTIEHQELQGYVDDQSKQWFYKPETNSNSWTGPYFPSRELAQKSFE
jgi:hypothetical protein